VRWAQPRSPPAMIPALLLPFLVENGVPGGVSCVLTRKELKEARNAYTRGVRLKDHRRLEEAFSQFDEASRLMPQIRSF